ncbi:MAG: MBL fold metallo-hydrolase [Spirochaetales bacterium]|nr:MBL fold metallo-hydrolase [Spirochaetales bacterium]
MDITLVASGSTQLDYMRKKWGLAFLIGDDVLFDTFCDPGMLERSFEKNNRDVRRINHVVISHEHWDHTGGLWWVIGNNPGVAVHVCGRFSEGFKLKITECGGSLVEVTKTGLIRENIYTTGEIEGSYAGNPIFEQSVIVKQDDKLAVVTGCSHPGILKILNYIGLDFKERIDLLTGGLHLKDAPKDEIGHITTLLEGIYNIKSIAAFHCTGEKTLTYFKRHMPRRFVKIADGDSFRFNTNLSSWELMKKDNVRP